MRISNIIPYSVERKLNSEIDEIYGSGRVPLWLALFDGDPAKDALWSETHLPRLNVTDPSFWLPAQMGVKANAAVFRFDPCLIEDERITHTAIYDAPRGGNLVDVYVGVRALEEPRKLSKGDIFSFQPGQFLIIQAVARLNPQRPVNALLN